MAEYYADAILHCYTDLTESIHYNDINFKLVGKYVISIKEKQDLDALQVGSITRCCRLLDLILGKNRDLAIFTEVLRTKHPYLAGIIEEERRKIESGERLPHLKVVEQQFKSFYKDTEYQLTEKLPGEEFTLDVSDESQLVPLFVTVEAADKEFLKKQKKGAKNVKLQYRYKQCSDVTSIDKVFDRDLIEEQNRLFICTGIAGVGKTVIMHRLAWQWAHDQHEYLHRFHVFIVIPLSKVDCGQPLMNILSEEGLGYININRKGTIHRLLEKCSKEVLFAIDGGDEVKIPPNCELRKLMTGELFPEAKVMIMARPDIHSLAAIADLNPDVKIHISGTSSDGISRYIEESLVSEQGSEDVIREFKKLVLQTDILHIPLYLAMVSVLFDHHWSNYANFANMKIPKTATDVLNSFMCIIIKIWLQKNNRNDEMSCCSFERCALEKCSRIPIDIRAKLVNMGRMSFECLLVQRYTFSDSDLERYLIERNDIHSCGMFRLKKGSENEFCFIHQIFQQYLSAVYLSHMQLKDAVFLDHINRKGTHTIETLFSPLELCVKFIFGMCPEFGKKLMETVLPRASCCMNKKSSATSEGVLSLNLQFESELCRESGDFSLVKTVEDFLVNTQAQCKTLDTQLSDYHFEAVYTLLAQFSENTCITLLDRIYNLKISKEENASWSIANNFPECKTSPNGQVTPFKAERDLSNKSSGDGGSGSADNVLDMKDGWCILNKIESEPMSGFKGSRYVTLIIDNLDATCYCLLSKFTFPEIEKLVVKHSMILDVDKLLPIFPCMLHLEISGNQNVDINVCAVSNVVGSLQKDRTPAVSLIEHLKIQVDERKTLPSVTASIFRNKNLKYMSITSLLVLVPWAECPELVPQLNQLCEITLSDCSVDKHMEQLCHVLKYTPGLEKIHIQNTSGDMCDKSKAEMLMTTISGCLASIQRLALVHTFDREGVDLMCSFLPKIPSLKQLSLGEWDLMDAKVSVLSVTSNISLHFYIWHVTRKEMRKVVGTRQFKVSPLALFDANKSSHDEC